MLSAATLIMLYKEGGGWEREKKKGKKKFKRDSELFSVMMGHLKSKWNNKVATTADCWEFGVRVSYGSASITKLNNACVVTVDYLDPKKKRKKRIHEEAKYGYDKKHMKRIISEKYLLWRLTRPSPSITNSNKHKYKVSEHNTRGALTACPLNTHFSCHNHLL